jgi:glycogen operon protein
MIRIDTHPTHVHGDFSLRVGKPLPFGATLVPEGVNFSIFSRHATYCELVLYRKDEVEPFAIIPFPEEFRIGNVYTMVVFDLDFENTDYAFHMDGPVDHRAGHWFDRRIPLMDPYARMIGGRDEWGKEPDWSKPYPHRSRVFFDDFNWENDKALEIPMEDLVIYEMHVRGFTAHPSSGVKHPGTFDALAEKIPYLKELGVNCVELMPIHEFDEFENSRVSPVTGQRLVNYWGYSNIGFFAPKAGYAATGVLGMQIDELKTVIKKLHAGGIEVILDVVFNHTAEGNENGPCISYRGIDNKTYYMLTPDGYYYNFSGCGNTLNCNNPIVRSMILDCLRFWASDYHVDGFRFDLASILGRDQNGAPMSNPPLLETLAFDPILGKCKLIAEAWDAGGLYQVGSFPSWGRWAEWNGRYRDDVRKFLKGDDGSVGGVAQRILGSPDLYAWQRRSPNSSINFITCHDGFTLIDLVSYNGKHNEANGEDNRDGNDDNISWNCGWEGPTDDPAVNELRVRQVKNAVGILLVSRGIPMILGGDEVGRTQKGNNNCYCQDNELSWMDWDLVKTNAEIFRFFKTMIAFRHAHPVLRGDSHFQNRDYAGSGRADITWHGTKAWQADFSGASRTLSFMLDGRHARGGAVRDDDIYVAMNMHWDAHWFEIPCPSEGAFWRVAANTGAQAPEDAWAPGMEPVLEDQRGILLGPRSIVVLAGRK